MSFKDSKHTIQQPWFIALSAATLLAVIFIIFLASDQNQGSNTSVSPWDDSTSNPKPKTPALIPQPNITNGQRTIIDSFNGYPCTSDCSGHEAGYNWAEENGISDADDCGGNSESFIEGCQSYVEENE